MSTETFLRGLDFDQLLHARQCADELIETRAAEKRLGVWVVEGHLFALQRFPEAAYLEAAEALLEEARGLAREPKMHRRVLSLTYKLVPESEYAGYFA